ncbi:uncharacterized protein LOC117336097 isoform X2 [Pecten maximus]|uniref:uncharacterized protein LOC117336097 isoform X2 n=1 Tax=Pecten maximus TaxID=6579 RepID=UPI001458DE9D|nr:uncharacterized protein LOC117336097 isoform X2 [Pecten maximus]
MTSIQSTPRSAPKEGVDISHLPDSAIQINTASKMPSGDMASHIYDQVITIIKKDPTDRTEVEIGRILPWFRKKSDLFKPLKNEVVQDLVKNCIFECVERDTVIIKQGDKGDCFFIILNGLVSIHINTTFGSDDDNPEDSGGGEGGGEKKEEKKGEEKKLDRSKYGNYVGKIEPGKSFGELALINADCVRNATIIADETTDLVVVNRDLYDRSLHYFQAKEFEERKAFVEGNPMFSNWQPKYKKQMAMSLRKEKLTFEAPILRQGTHVDGLCFLLSGQARIIADNSMHATQYPSYFPLTDIQDLQKVEARESLRRELSMPSPKPDEYKYLSRQKSPTQETKSGKKSPHIHRHVEICLIGALEIIGDLELITGLPTYAQTVICTQEAEVYVLDQKNYDRLIEKRNPQVIEMMKRLLMEKYKLRLSWIQDKELPLIRYLLYKLEEKERQKRQRYLQRNVTEKVADWPSDGARRGPFIDMYGPGSVFYSIRMREKQKKLERMRFGRQTAKEKADKASNLNLNSSGMITQIQLSNLEADENYQDNFDEDGFGLTSGSHLICDNAKERVEAAGDASPEDFRDLETSEDALSNLEQRIEAWHTSLPSKDSKRQCKKTVKLHRLLLEDSRKPLPGKKVYLRPKTRHKANFIQDLKNEQTQSQDMSHIYRESVPSSNLKSEIFITEPAVSAGEAPGYRGLSLAAPPPSVWSSGHEGRNQPDSTR